MKILLIIMIFFLQGCSIWKKNLILSGSKNNIVHNAVIDFIHTSNCLKKDSVFEVLINDSLFDGITVVSIAKAYNKLYPEVENRIGTNHDKTFPTCFIENGHKLFYWYDCSYTINQDLIDVLSKYGQIDSMYFKGINEFAEYIINDGEEGICYFFCNNNLKRYKKTGISNISKRYKIPDFDCK